MISSKHEIEELIHSQSVAFISSIDEDGFPNSKAMLPPRKVLGLTEFYFTTNTSSARVRQYKNNPKACIYFCDSGLFKGAMLKGTMEVLEDIESKKLIWQDGDEQYYSKGVTDPDYCVLKFTANSARTYSNFNSGNVEIYV